MNGNIRSLIAIVVQEQDADLARRALEKLSLPVTHLSTQGGFLGRRNATFLVGLSEGAAGQVTESLRQVCRQRVEYLALPLEGSPLPLPTPVPVTVGGATLFTLPIDWFEEM